MVHWNPLLVLLVMTELYSLLQGEYYIKDGAIPSYLYWHQYDSKENIFPKDITVNISMSRVTGTFMYGFDRNMNQLIVTMRDGLPHVMDIELNKQRVSVTLPSICGCDRCRYEVLELRIQLGYYIRVQCNGGKLHMFKNENNKELNEKYPIVHKRTRRTLNSNKESYLWLGNTPEYDDIYPNIYQLYGCIFNVLYNEQSISFTEVTSNIGDKCIKTCTDNICNGGQCYETFSGAPICNCTSTFRNGPYCNDSILPLNIRANVGRFKMKSVKISWNSSVPNIFAVTNECLSIILGLEQSALVLQFKSNRSLYKAIISSIYVPNKEYICILHLRKRQIDILLFAHGSWAHEVMSVNVDLSGELFNSILLQSGDGTIDIVYKDDEEYSWRKLIIRKYTDLQPIGSHESNSNERTTSSFTESAESRKYNGKTTIIIGSMLSKSITFGLSIGLPIIVTVAVAVIIWYFRFRKKKERPNQRKSSPLLSNAKLDG